MNSLLRASALLLGAALFAVPAEAAETADVSLAKEVDQYLQEASPDAKSDTSFKGEWKDGPRWTSGDKRFQVKLQGRLMTDWFWIESDDFDSSVTADGVFFRRVRLAVAGHAYTNTIFKVQVDFAKGTVELKDVYVGLKNISSLKFTFVSGHEKEPFSLEELTSSKYITFIERSAPTNAFAPSRNVGLSFGTEELANGHVSFKIGIYKSTDDTGMQMVDGGYAFTFRIAGFFWEDEETNRLIHAGFSLSFRDTDEDEARFRARFGPGKGDRLVDTGTLSADEVLLLGFELAARWRAFHFALEWFIADVTGVGGAPDPSFTGYYIEIGWWLTGESRSYKGFTWGRTKPTRNLHDTDAGYGGLQLAFRFDFIDLIDSGIAGGEHTTYTFGVNWHWNPNTRVMFNVVFADVEGPAPSGLGELTVFLTRFQWDF